MYLYITKTEFTFLYMKATRFLQFSIFGLALCASAQTPNSVSNIKFALASEPVANQSAIVSQPAKQFYHATYAGAAWGDFNNDDKIDLFYSDKNPLIDNNVQSNLYTNNGNGTFNRVFKSPFKGTAWACPVWFDPNNDGLLDMLLIGINNHGYAWKDFSTDFSQFKSQLYINKGNNANNETQFEEIDDSGILPIFNGLAGGKGHNWITVGDYNKDGLTDVLMTGFDECNRIKKDDFEDALRVMYLYKNIDGTHFELQETPVDGTSKFHGMTDGSAVFADIDGDGWLDILSSGYGYTRTSELHLYWNNQDGTFTESSLAVKNVSHSSCSVADLNNDQLPELVLSGTYQNTNTKFFYIVKNLGNRQFDTQNPIYYEGMDGVQLSFGDINQDGLADILTSGHGATNEHTTIILANQGNLNFEVYGAHYNDPFGKKGHFTRVSHGSNALVDVNSDGYLDAWISGWSAGKCNKGCDTELWMNNSSQKSINPNTAPSAPSNLQASADENGMITFTWDAAADDFTPAGGLRYNLYLKKVDSDQCFMVVPANTATGFIKTANHTNFIYQCFYKTLITESGEYEWGVQAIDNGNIGGQFASKTQTFNISGINNALNDDTNINVWAENGAIFFSSNTESAMKVYNMAGIEIASANPAISGSVNVDCAGIYLAKVTNKSAQKVIRIQIK